MLNKKGFTFTEISDVSIGIIIFIFAILIFNFFSGIADVNTEKQKLKEIYSFEYKEQKLDLINFISDNEIEDFFINFDSQDYNSKDFTQGIYCSNDLKSKFQDKLQFNVWSISLYDDENIIFSCSSKSFYKEDAIIEKIIIPTSQPDKTRRIEFYYKNE